MIVLSGEADISSAVQLTALIGSQLNAGAVHLTINASGLSYVDSMALHVLVVAAKILRARGGALVLLRPQRQVARTLTLMAADQLITIRRGLEVAPQPGSDAELAPGRRVRNPLCAVPAGRAALIYGIPAPLMARGRRTAVLAGGSAGWPPPTRRRRIRGFPVPVKTLCDGRAITGGEDALVNVHAKRILTVPVRRLEFGSGRVGGRSGEFRKGAHAPGEANRCGSWQSWNARRGDLGRRRGSTRQADVVAMSNGEPRMLSENH